MLQSVSVEGFKSFKNYAEVDLKKTQYQILEKTNVKDGILKGCMALIDLGLINIVQDE